MLPSSQLLNLFREAVNPTCEEHKGGSLWNAFNAVTELAKRYTDPVDYQARTLKLHVPVSIDEVMQLQSSFTPPKELPAPDETRDPLLYPEKGYAEDNGESPEDLGPADAADGAITVEAEDYEPGTEQPARRPTRHTRPLRRPAHGGNPGRIGRYRDPHPERRTPAECRGTLRASGNHGEIRGHLRGGCGPTGVTTR